MNGEPLTEDLEEDLADYISKVCPSADVVIATDFGHGLIGPRIVRQLTELSPFLAVNTQSNSANLGYNLITRYPRADYICIHAPEARLALRDRLSTLGHIAHRLPARIPDCPKIVVTHRKHRRASY